MTYDHIKGIEAFNLIRHTIINSDLLNYVISFCSSEFLCDQVNVMIRARKVVYHRFVDQWLVLSMGRVSRSRL